MSFDELRFVHPALLWLLGLVVPLVGLYLATFLARRRVLASFGGPHAALVSSSGRRQVVRAALALVAATSLGVALAGPYVEERTVEARWKGVDLVVALDVSQSMGTQDVKPDRLHVARGAIQSLTEQLPGSRAALVLFGASGVLRYPGTMDPKVIARSLDSIGRSFRPTAGSSLRAGLDASLDAFPQDSALPKAILVLSDGEDLTTLEVDVARLRARDVRVFALAVGTEAGGSVPTYDNIGRYLGPLVGPNGTVVSRMREDLLRRITDATGGKQWRYDGTDDEPVRELAAGLQAMGTGELTGATQQEPDDRYQPFVVIAIAALLLEWVVSDRRPMPRPGSARIRGARRSLLIGTLLALVLASCGDAAATNETANGRFSAGDFPGALERYKALLREHPDAPELSINAGNALYRSGDFARALPNYEAALATPDKKVRAVALYDKGDALFRLGQLREAREAYADALRLDPNDRDAKFNIEVIDRMQAAQGQGQPQPGQPQPGGQSQGQPAPGTSAQPGQQGQPGPQQGGPQQQGQRDQGQPGGQGQESVEQALQEFRQNLTPEEALRLLDALMRQQRGVQTLLEGGPRRVGQEPQY